MNEPEQPRSDANGDGRETGEPDWISVYKIAMGFVAFVGFMAWLLGIGAGTTAVESAAISAFAGVCILVVD